MYAFTQAWNFLKADPEMQIQGRGTAPRPIQGMMERAGRPMTDATRPVEPWREHTGTNPEESFLTPSERYQAQQGLGANLRRNVGGQQSGTFMGPMRHKLNTEVGVSRGMKLKPHARQFEEKEPVQSEDQKLDAMLAEMAAMSGGQLSHTPAELPDPEPKEQPDLRGGVGAVARRAEMDDRMRDSSVKPDLSGIELDPRQGQAMAGGDMGEMDFGGDGQPMMGQQGLRERLFQIANDKARAKFGAPAPAGQPEVPSEIQAMQAEIDRRS